MPMKLKTTRKEIVQEYNYGLWVWETPDGAIVSDGDGAFMNTPGLRHDPAAVERITNAARHYGFPEGRPLFWQGRRQLTDEQYAEQIAREQAGLVADPFDMGAIQDEMRAKKYNNGER